MNEPNPVGEFLYCFWGALLNAALAALNLVAFLAAGSVWSLAAVVFISAMGIFCYVTGKDIKRTRASTRRIEADIARMRSDRAGF